MSDSTLIHASAVEISGRGVLITGPSGSGKSDLALRLIDRGARLIADDQTALRAEEHRLLARAPHAIRGKLEIRGCGIVTLDAIDDVAVALLINLGRDGERLPRPVTHRICGVAVPEMTLDPRPASAPIKVEWLLAHPNMVIA